MKTMFCEVCWCNTYVMERSEHLYKHTALKCDSYCHIRKESKKLYGTTGILTRGKHLFP
jgi:hypothetical protein